MQGDLASLRVILGLVVIWIIFQSQNDRFLTAVNLTNLMLQITAVGLISVGVVYVLLLGEIDLSVGAVSGLAAAVMAVLNVKHGWDPYLAIAAGVLAGMAIGVVQGALSTGFGIPSFVVTLAGLLTWQGALLYVLGDTGTINITDSKITGLANTFYSDAVGWTMALVAIGVYAAATLWAWRQRVVAGLADRQLTGPLIRIVVVAAAVIAAVAILNSDRGVPLAVLILVGFVAGMEYIAQAHALRPSRLCRGRQRRGGAAGGNQRACDPRDRVRDRGVDGGDRRHHAGLAAAGREPGLRRKRPAAARDRGPGDRGHEPVRWPGLGLVGAARRARDRLDLERDGPAGARVLGQVHGHRRRPARGCDRGRDRAQAAAGRRPRVTPARSKRRCVRAGACRPATPAPARA